MKKIIRELEDGLIIRHAGVEDAEALAKFNGGIHADPDEGFAEHVASATRDMMTRPHPTVNAADFTIVEDPANGKIVSTLNLIPQTWTLGGIEFEVGRPELVGTDPAYRRRGLVRAQMEIVHQWSQERGHMVQAITGIPWYYRMFGYEMCLDLGGGRRGYAAHVPALKDKEEEPFNLRPAAETDLPLIAELYKIGCQRSLVSCPRDAKMWQYEWDGRSLKNMEKINFHILETPAGAAVGFIGMRNMLWGKVLPLFLFEVAEGVSWVEASHSVLRYLRTQTEERFKQDDKEGNFDSFYFYLGAEHPAFEAIPDRLPRENAPYAFYMRVPDLPGFLRHIQPILQERLNQSALAGYTGELTLNFYTDGLRFAFEKGVITALEAWQPPNFEAGMALFPNLTFLQLVFGYRDFDEVAYAYPDCYYRGAHPDAAVLLRALFPKQASAVWAFE